MKHYHRITTGLCTFLCLIIMITIYSQNNTTRANLKTENTNNGLFSRALNWLGFNQEAETTVAPKTVSKEEKESKDICKIILENKQEKE